MGPHLLGRAPPDGTPPSHSGRYAIATTINEGEIRGSLPKGAPMPNVVRLKILAARHLIDLPNLKPRIEVSLRKTKVSTAVGKRAWPR